MSDKDITELIRDAMDSPGEGVKRRWRLHPMEVLGIVAIVCVTAAAIVTIVLRG